MNDKLVNVETLPNGQLFLRSIKYPDHGWIVEPIETLSDSRQFCRSATKADWGLVVEERLDEQGRWCLYPMDYIQRPANYPTRQQGARADTKTLVVGERVEIVSGACTRGFGTVVKVTPTGGEVQMDGEGILRFDSNGMTQMQDTPECGPWFIYYVPDKS